MGRPFILLISFLYHYVFTGLDGAKAINNRAEVSRGLRRIHLQRLLLGFPFFREGFARKLQSRSSAIDSSSLVQFATKLDQDFGDGELATAQREMQGCGESAESINVRICWEVDICANCF